LRDRSKDMIIGGGSSIYPREIEEVLLRHPDLIEVSVVRRPHRQRGEEVVAFSLRRRPAEEQFWQSAENRAAPPDEPER